MSTPEGFGTYFLAARLSELTSDHPDLLATEARLFRSYWLVTHSGVHELARIRAAADFIQKCVQESGHIFLPGGPA